MPRRVTISIDSRKISFEVGDDSHVSVAIDKDGSKPAATRRELDEEAARARAAATRPVSVAIDEDGSKPAATRRELDEEAARARAAAATRPRKRLRAASLLDREWSWRAAILTLMYADDNPDWSAGKIANEVGRHKAEYDANRARRRRGAATRRELDEEAARARAAATRHRKLTPADYLRDREWYQRAAIMRLMYADDNPDWNSVEIGRAVDRHMKAVARHMAAYEANLARRRREAE